MATSTNKPRSSYFSPAELQILMTAYRKRAYIFTKKQYYGSSQKAGARVEKYSWPSQSIWEKENVFSWMFHLFNNYIPYVCLCAQVQPNRPQTDLAATKNEI